MDPWFPYARGSLSTVNGCGVLSTTRRAASRPRSCKSDAISSEFSESNARLSTDPKIKPAVSAASDCVRHANLFRRRDDDEDGSEEAFVSSGTTPALAPTPSARAPLPEASLETRIEGLLQRGVRLWTGDGLWFLLGMGALVVGPLLMLQEPARNFYFLFDESGAPSIRPSELRSGRPLEKLLRPGGQLGLWFGIIGAGLFLTNLTYVLRRRFSLLARWIGLRTWLNVHAVTGLLGASLILVHSSLLFNNVPAVISFTGIMVAVCCGVPRNG